MGVLKSFMKENDIRPDKLLNKQQEYIQEDIDFLLSQKEKFIDINCPACDFYNERLEFNKNGFDYLECQNCGMLYLSPRPTPEVLSKFYSNSPNYKFFNDYIFPASKETRREKIFIPRVKKVLEICKKYNFKNDKIIEIGAGFGLFCEEMVKTDYFKEVVGIEASNSLFETCKDKGFRIYNGILEELKINEKFNFAAAFEVVEHVFSPFDFLKNIYNLLEKDSFLMLTFPNYEGFDISTLRRKSKSIDHEHLNYFTSNSINILLNRCGFKLVELETPGKLDVDLVRKEIINNDFQANSFIKNICVNHFDTVGQEFQKFLMDNHLSSNMLVIAKRLN